MRSLGEVQRPIRDPEETDVTFPMETPQHPLPEPSAPLLTHDQFVVRYQAGHPDALWAVIQTLQECLGRLHQDFDQVRIGTAGIVLSPPRAMGTGNLRRKANAGPVGKRSEANHRDPLSRLALYLIRVSSAKTQTRRTYGNVAIHSRCDLYGGRKSWWATKRSSTKCHSWFNDSVADI